MQRGYGNILGSLIRSGIPLLKSLIKSPIAKQIGKEALRTGREMLGDVVVKKRSIKGSAKKRVSQAARRQLLEANLPETLLKRYHGGSTGYTKRRKTSLLDILGN